jgi:bifunctional non-homologous end joining protein LigD
MTAARKSAETIAFGLRKVTITHPERVLFPKDGITKADLAHYYRDVAHWILPYLKDRPLTLQRFPQGIGGSSFFEKQAPKGSPEWVRTITLPSSSGKRATIAYVVCDDEATLLWLANLGTITLHVWMSRIASLDHPDYALFDLDPWEGCAMRTLAGVALALRATLGEIGLEPLVKTTGGKGLHVIVPLRLDYDYEQVRDFGELVARRVHGALPDGVTLERRKEKRARGAVYIDWVQLGQGKTLVPPFSVRARDGGPVSMPLAWSDVEELAASRAKETLRDLARWNVTSVPALLAERGDPWKKPYAKKLAIEPALKKARALWEK